MFGRIVLVVVVALLIWRGRRLDAFDRTHGYGPYADLRPRPPT